MLSLSPGTVDIAILFWLASSRHLKEAGEGTLRESCRERSILLVTKKIDRRSPDIDIALSRWQKLQISRLFEVAHFLATDVLRTSWITNRTELGQEKFWRHARLQYRNDDAMKSKSEMWTYVAEKKLTVDERFRFDTALYQFPQYCQSPFVKPSL